MLKMYILSNESGEKLEGIDGVDFKDLNYNISNGNYVNNGKVDIRAYLMKSKRRYYYFDEGDLSSEDVELNGNNAPAVSETNVATTGSQVTVTTGWN